MRMILVIMGLVPIVLAGCRPFSTDPVMLRHPKTGVTVQCGPYSYGTQTASAEAMREIKCIEDYQRQGYQRVPK